MSRRRPVGYMDLPINLRDSLVMNKTPLRLLGVLLIAFFVGVPLTAQPQVTLQIIWKTKMKFGDVASSIDGPGTVVIDAVNNTRSVTGSAFDFGGTWQRGKFQLVGQPKAYVIVTLPSSFTLTNDSGAFSIVVDNITMSETNPIRLNNQGKKNVFIGGRVNISTNQKDRNYNNGGGFIDAEYL
ncbi:MAG: DUF4402 domain-containing protein [Rhodospirillales bacterium]|nr:DUF4402 domain-containing protein [Rhodospirillales bacterium]